MIGQGRPSSSALVTARAAPLRLRVTRLGRRALAHGATLVVWLCLALTAVAQVDLTGEPLRLRITWGTGQASRWHGRIALDKGSLSDLELLGLNADAAGSIWLEDGVVRVALLSAHQADAIEISAAASKDAKLLIEFSTAAGAAPLRAEVQLAEVRRNPYALPLDNLGNSLRVEIAPHNALRIATDRGVFIFSPGEQFAFELQAVLPDLVAGTSLDIRSTLSPARGKETLWSDEQRLEVPVDGHPTVMLRAPLPAAEGVYRIHVAATRPSGFRERFFPGAAAPLAERSLEIVVLDPRRQDATPTDPWEKMLEIDPSNARWSERLPSWAQVRRIPGLNRGPLGSMRAGTIDHPLGRFVELPPTAPGAEPHWQAYSLPLEAVGAPYLLEIDYPADQEQHFGVSIVEPNAAGVVEGIGRDTGVYVEGLGRSELTQKQTHRLVFWPRTQAPLLLVTNHHPTAPAHFGHVRVSKRKANQLTASQPPGPLPSDRLVAAYLAGPFAAETFGVSAGPSAAGRLNADARNTSDWQSLYESGTRLADYLRYSGYNGAVVSAVADGRSIYPSRMLLSPTWRDTHCAAAGVPEASTTDGFELTLRVFDRDQLALIPAMQFAAPLAELEPLRRGSDPQTSGLEWVGPDGRTWLETQGAKDGLAPYYNLLDLRVQQAMFQVIRELLDRYGHHPALAGLAIQLSGDGYAQLPPLDWGLDDATVGRFERDTRILLAATGPDRFAARHALLTGQHADVWRAWRAARVTQFYDQLAALLRSNNNQRRLLLTTEQSLSHPQLAARIRPNILAESRVDATLLDLGIHRQWLQRVPGIVVCPTRYVEPMVPLPDRAADLELNEAFAAWQVNPASPSAALLYHRPQRLRVTSFAAKSPFKVAGDVEIVSQPLPHGAAVRQPYVATLLNTDPAIVVDGGELLPLGQEDALREVRTILQRLPVTAQVAEVHQQPLLVRTYSEPTGVTLLVVNTCPWRAKAQITLDVSQAATLEPLVGANGKSEAAVVPRRDLAPGKQPWTLSLEPYGVQAVRIAAVDVKVANARADVSDAAKTELAARLTDLAERDLTAPRDYPALTNAGFEPLGGGALPGWQLAGNSQTATADLDGTAPRGGKTCLYFQSRGQFAALESNIFPTPPTGQLAVTVFVRGLDANPRSELRMVLEAERAGHVYRRSAIVGSPAAPATQRTDDPWGRPYAILVNDLPLDSRGKMRIKFELSGPGEVWLDEVKLYDLLFPLSFYANARTEKLEFLQLIHAAQSAYEAGRVTDSVQWLESYWPRFLTAYTPLVERKVAAELPKTGPPPPADQQQQPTPSLGERIKKFMPTWR